MREHQNSKNNERILEIWFGSLTSSLVIDPVTISYPSSYYEQFSSKSNRLFLGNSCFIPPILSIIISDCKMYFLEPDEVNMIDSL